MKKPKEVLRKFHPDWIRHCRKIEKAYRERGSLEEIPFSGKFYLDEDDGKFKKTKAIKEKK